MSVDFPFHYRTIEGAAEGPHLLITAGVHGDEFEGMAAVRRLVTEIDPQSLRGRVTLVPVVNEPAFLRSQRTADDGLDLARTCPGKADGSITERIAHFLSVLIRSADYYIDLHSGGTVMSISPLTGYMLHSDPEVLESQRKMARAFNLSLVWGTSSSLEGRSLSVARDAGVPAIYAEYLGSGLCSAEGVRDYTQSCFDVMRALKMLDRVAPPSRVERIVEDNRDQSGHLQICHSSPISGFFERVVELGQTIRAGDPIGRVVDPLGENSVEVRAEHGGTVIGVITFSRVMEGTALAVVLETGVPGIVERRTEHFSIRNSTVERPVAIITGGSRGIGRATALEFANRGYNVALVGTDSDALNEVANEVERCDVNAKSLPGDLGDLGFAESVVKRTVEDWGRIDALVNNAAWREIVTMRQISVESWEKTLRVCLTAPAFLARWAAESMEPRRKGVIVNVSSMMSQQAAGISPAYVACKGALDSLTYELAALYGPAGIRVVGINPGAIDTAMSRGLESAPNDSEEATRDFSEDMIMLRRWGTPEEIARAIAWAASDDASYLTGTCLVIDGGWFHQHFPHSLKQRQFPNQFP